MPAPKELDPTTSLPAYLGDLVRRLRQAKGLSQRELGQLCFVAHTRIAQIELATDPPNWDLVKLIDAALEAKGAVTSLWVHFNGPVMDYAKVFLLRQAQARMIQEYSPVIPGLAQTEAYARAMLTAGEGLFGDATVEETLPGRLARQEILKGQNPPWYRITLHESALHLNIGGRDAMCGQLAHLLKLNERRRIDVQVVPFGSLDPTAVNGSLCLLTMEDGSRAAYTEGFNIGHYLERPEDVTRMALIYDRVQAAALPPDLSAAFIKNVMEERYAWELPPLT
ncbi:helix-turn-helix domain-containing protein [Kitasatospora azatica]|uniref:helix-turn-helix domain-containing protein n=1 Tax=Kitasatospora azatica TaxID=58347 RepID=UPI000568393F|nr:helix-turn-helix transcriptional regulator [Kitasatospora azatica]